MTEKQKTIVLTGGSRGIGHATGKYFWKAGWRVITCSRQSFPKDHPGMVGPENYVQIDLSDREVLAAGVEEIRNRLDGAPRSEIVRGAENRQEDRLRLRHYSSLASRGGQVFTGVRPSPFVRKIVSPAARKTPQRSAANSPRNTGLLLDLCYLGLLNPHDLQDRCGEQ